MAGSAEEYLITRSKQIKRRQKFLTIVSMVSFLGSIVFAAVPAVQQAIEKPKAVVKSPEISLQQQARGFELVLQREPENPVALEGLVNIRIQTKDTKSAIAPLEKLAKLHPERQEYKVLLEQLQKQVGKSEEKSDRSPK